MFFRRMLCALLVWMVLGVRQRCCYAQSAREVALPTEAPTAPAESEPAPSSETQAQAGQQALDADAQIRHPFVVARRQWQDVLAKRKAGQKKEALTSYVLYLNAAYTANGNRWLLLELGRTLEQLGQPEDALSAYRRYLVGMSAEIENPADRREAERAVERLADMLMRKMNVLLPSSGEQSSILTKAGLITLSGGLATAAASTIVFVSYRPQTTVCNINDPRSNCIGDSIGRELFKVLLIAISITGGVAAVSGGSLLIAGLSSRTPRYASRAAAVSLTPEISSNTVGLMAIGRF
jgi:hypothetical protein